MELIEQSWEWIKKPEGALELIELAGRTCYKSEDKITPGSSVNFLRRIKTSGHHSVIEHAVASVRFIIDRGVTHELVRHRLCSFSQESTRYCNYGGDHIKFIRPVWLDIPCKVYKRHEFQLFEFATVEYIFIDSILVAEEAYKYLLELGQRLEQARQVLPNSLKTEIVVTANLREWMHIFNLRCSPAAHPQIRELMISCREGFRKEVPILFD
jgi:thymidylate synthase (FAD)